MMAQPDNDQFANRFFLNGDDVAVEGTFLDASREIGEDTANGAGFGEASVWWSWRAPRDGHVRVSASAFAGVPVQRLEVFDGDTLSSLSLLSSAEFQSQRPDVQSIVPVQAGRSYAIATINSQGVEAFFNLRLILLPPGDVVPIPLEGEAFDLEGTTVHATPEPGLSGDPGQAPTVSWEWTAPGDGAVWIATDADDYALRVHVFRIDAFNQWRGKSLLTLLLRAGWALSHKPPAATGYCSVPTPVRNDPFTGK